MKVSIKKYIAKLPKSPGVYKFYDARDRLIYMGKATFLRDRVRSYFTGAHDVKTEKLVSEIKKISFQKTETVLEALILESNLIKKYQPKYNIREKDDKSFSYFLITKNEEFSRVLIVRKTDLGKYTAKKIYGPYTSKKQMEVALKILRRILPFHSIKQKTEKGCLDYQLERCPGPYAGAISKQDYFKNIRGIEMILQGKKQGLVKKLEKEMQGFSKKHRYEKAAEIRNKIFALKHIQDVALISDSSRQSSVVSRQSIRIEAYDISNIGGQYAVGSMVVFLNSKPDKSQYRKFKIKTVPGIDDVGMIKEILERRFRNDWPKPDLILIDGGKGHLNAALNVIIDYKLNIPAAAVAKGPTRKKLDIYYSKNATKYFNILGNTPLIEKIRNEAHWFAIAYHRKVRRKEWKSF